MNPTIGITSLGYICLPLAVEFGKHYTTIGFGIDPHRIDQLKAGAIRRARWRRWNLLAPHTSSYSCDAADLQKRYAVPCQSPNTD